MTAILKNDATNQALQTAFVNLNIEGRNFPHVGKMVSHNLCQLFLSLHELTVICNFFRSKSKASNT
ncbi:Uncharacterised protein [Streptococcus pneumoniae]|nr:Uncharacterised protein [Streptococcus pneumoniae]